MVAGRFAAWRRIAGVSALFVVLTGVMTWPQPAVLATHALDHQDVFFNIWRLRWVHRALTTADASLFDGNQFHPERRVLAYSDAMLVEGLVAAPLLSARVGPVLVHNLLLLGAIAASGVGMFVLARHLSGTTAGGVAAGIIFAFAPYRFDHYMHMELQWAMWSPWAFWALQRTIETRGWRFGALTGVFIALQILSSVYYGMFLAMLIAVVGVVQVLPLGRRDAAHVLRALLAGAAIAIAASWAYSRPYEAAARRVGTREIAQVRAFSARPRSYLSATSTNILYGRRYRGAPERRLFPGVLPLLLALVALFLALPPPFVIAYAVGLAAAFELSLGMNGLLYPFLYDHVGVIRALRAPARASIFCLAFLGVLAAHGIALLTAHRRPLVHWLFAGACIAGLIAEYRVAPLPLTEHPVEAPPVYAWLAAQPRGVVAEFPMPRAEQLPGDDPRYLYTSTFHWMPLVNGYSGYYPPSYLSRLTVLEAFPDDQALMQLRRDGVAYVIVHAARYTRDVFAHIERRLSEAGAERLTVLWDGWGHAAVFRMK